MESSTLSLNPFMSTVDDISAHNNVTSGQYLLHGAAESGDIDTLADLLELHPYSVNAQTYDLVSPLHVACFHGHVACSELLLKKGAHVDSRNIDGATPLCDACCNGSRECVELLLQHGADPNPLYLQGSPLHEAILRVYRGYDDSVPDNHECVALMVKAGANLDRSDCWFGTPLHVAAYKCYIDSARILINAGANVNVSKNLHTPLHDVATVDCWPFVSLLLDAGANVYAEDTSGLTAYDLSPPRSVSRSILSDWEKNPRSLKHFSRLAARKWLQRHRLSVDQILLPAQLRTYLMFADSLPS